MYLYFKERKCDPHNLGLWIGIEKDLMFHQASNHAFYKIFLSSFN